MDDAVAEALALELIALHDSPRELPPFTERYRGLTPAAGYGAARRLHSDRLGRGWRPRGRKIGFTNRNLWERYGVHEPVWGTVYDRTLLNAREGRARVSLAGLVQPRIEPEVCFGLSASPRDRSAQALLAAISWVAHSIEIVQCHHPGWKVTIADCTTDNGLHGRLVVGDRIDLVDLPALADRLPALEVTLLRGGLVVDRGVGANVLGSPLESLGYLVDLLARQPEAPPLAAGEVVTTGVLTDAHPVRPGEVWSTALTGLPLPGLVVEFSEEAARDAE
jgi:2-oxo-3-hexenedioate decarboxylase